MQPIVLFNFKGYLNSFDKKGFEIAKKIEKIAFKFKVNFWLAPHHLDLKDFAKKLRIKIVSQSIDPKDFGAATGSIQAIFLKKIGCYATLINHSEKRIKYNDIARCIELARNYKLKTICCAKSIKEAKKILKLDPDFIAYEPPELIGSGVAVSKAKPKIVERFVKLCDQWSIPLIGAGISSSEDVKRSLELGAKGALISSALIKASNKEKFLIEIAKSLKMVG